MWDHSTGRSKGYGFVAMRSREEAQNAIEKMHGQVGSRKRCDCSCACARVRFCTMPQQHYIMEQVVTAAQQAAAHARRMPEGSADSCHGCVCRLLNSCAVGSPQPCAFSHVAHQHSLSLSLGNRWHGPGTFQP